MPSMDIVSKLDKQELLNAVDQANREISNRFDFKGTDSKIELADNVITLVSQSEFQVQQLDDILLKKLAKRSIDVGCLDYSEPEESGKQVKQKIVAREGIDKELGRKLVKDIKQMKLKVQASIQEDQVRVSGKKRDDLQEVIAALKKADVGLPLQFVNFRD